MLSVNYFGYQSLSWAASKGYGRVVRALLDHGADPKIYSNDGQTPSDIAYSSDHPRVSYKKNSETQRLVQNVILKLEKINMVLVKPTMVKQP